MDWKRERDTLIAQSYAFVQSVAGKLAEAAAARLEARLPPVTPLQVRPEVRIPRAEVAPETVEAAPEAPVKRPPNVAPLPVVHSEIEDEIRARVASFRAHQERFNRERAEYFSATIARLRAALDEVPTPHARHVSALHVPVSLRSSPRPAADSPETFPDFRSSGNGRDPA
jgi:LmbE family N-acetylglucosaminyl deacetylase